MQLRQQKSYIIRSNNNDSDEYSFNFKNKTEKTVLSQFAEAPS